ncbi:hypothetical protein NL676_029894 [Syzygium grande]|nr:hypothetical protein NL676_029894 [Syzygium grande]
MNVTIRNLNLGLTTLSAATAAPALLYALTITWLVTRSLDSLLFSMSSVVRSLDNRDEVGNLSHDCRP